MSKLSRRHKRPTKTTKARTIIEVSVASQRKARAPERTNLHPVPRTQPTPHHYLVHVTTHMCNCCHSAWTQSTTILVSYLRNTELRSAIHTPQYKLPIRTVQTRGNSTAFCGRCPPDMLRMSLDALPPPPTPDPVIDQRILNWRSLTEDGVKAYKPEPKPKPTRGEPKTPPTLDQLKTLFGA